jgi:hypothetical protein
MESFQAAGRRDGQRGSKSQGSQSSLWGIEKGSGRTGRVMDEFGECASEARFPWVMRDSRQRRCDLDLGSY